VSGGKLTALQWRILEALAPVRPAWTLSGGAALAGIHLKHRATRDIDLFWREQPELYSIPRDVEAALKHEGLVVQVVQTSPTFCRLNAVEGAEACIVDLVAEPVAALGPPQSFSLSGIVIAVDTPHEILVSKLCTLLSRAEIRDLVDVRALIEAGGDFDLALADAPKKDAGFSALTLSWVLSTTQVHPMAKAIGWGTEETDAVASFKDLLVQRLLSAAAPE